MNIKNIPPAGKSLKVAAMKAPPAVKMAKKVKAPAVSSKSHNPANQLSAMPYANGGKVGKRMKGC